MSQPALEQQQDNQLVMEMPVTVQAQPLKQYQEELVHVRRQQTVCAHNKIEIYLESSTLRCTDCGRSWE